MIKIVCCLRRKPTLTHAEFVAYWQNVHGKMVTDHQATLRLSRYLQSVTINHQFTPVVEDRSIRQDPFDGVAELYWKDEADFHHSLTDPDARRIQKLLAIDEDNFIDRTRSSRWITTETQVI